MFIAFPGRAGGTPFGGKGYVRKGARKQPTIRQLFWGSLSLMHF